MDQSSSNVHPEPKPHIRAQSRIPAVAALLASGMTQQATADALGVTRSTVKRDMAAGAREGAEAAISILARAQAHIEVLMPIERRVEKYVDIAKDASNEGVSLAALMRLDDLDGIVTQKELVRTRRDEAYNVSGPMFVMAEGAQVNVTLNQAAPQGVVGVQDTQVVIDVEVAQVVENKE